MKIIDNRVIVYETEGESRANLHTELHIAYYWLRTTNKKVWEFTLNINDKYDDIFNYYKTLGVFFYKYPVNNEHSKKIKHYGLYQYNITLNNKGRYYYKIQEIIGKKTYGKVYTFLMGRFFGYSLNKIIKFIFECRSGIHKTNKNVGGK